VIKGFLQGHGEFRLVVPEVDSSLVTCDGFVRTYPHIHGTAGFFTAVLERRTD
jgi:16S rRNA (cytosine967-C5)-methyltransferase